MSAYYNEIDPFAAAWLKELIKAGHIAPGEVDTRSIEDVVPSDLAGFEQCHFFAGVGVWSYALRCAGWPDGRPVWTGSCPCQPFSTAGKRKGTSDERHLWPAFFHLISQCRPPVVFGEQVASRDGLGWFDLVSTDMEGAGYACGAVDTCAAGIGAPHIRQRLYWVADAGHGEYQRWHTVGNPVCTNDGAPSPLCGTWPEWERSGHDTANGGTGNGLAHAESRTVRAGFCDPVQIGERRPVVTDGSATCGLADAPGGAEWGEWKAGQAARPQRQAGRCCSPCRLDNSIGEGLEGHSGHVHGEAGREDAAGSVAEAGGTGGLENACGHGRQAGGVHNDGDDGGQSGAAGALFWPGPTNGYWQAADWLFCRDGKWRPVEPGTCPLAHGAANRVGRLRGYGNAIVAPQAEAFIRAFLELSHRHD